MSALSAIRSAGAGSPACRAPRGGADGVERGPGVAEQDFPGLDERDLPSSAGEQLHAELALQLPDRPGQRRLRRPQPRGRPPEVQFLLHNHEFSNALYTRQLTCSYVIFGGSSIRSSHDGRT
jgi:hypothetical protein